MSDDAYVPYHVQEARQRRTEQDRAAVRAFLEWARLRGAGYALNVLVDRWPGTEGR